VYTVYRLQRPSEGSVMKKINVCLIKTMDSDCKLMMFVAASFRKRSSAVYTYLILYSYSGIISTLVILSEWTTTSRCSLYKDYDISRGQTHSQLLFADNKFVKKQSSRLQTIKSNIKACKRLSCTRSEGEIFFY